MPTPDSGRPSTVAGDLSQIAADVDFAPYLRAVTEASQRTRSILYVLVVTLIAVFAAWRNTAMPDWLDVRLQQLQTAYGCLRDGTRIDATCDDAIKYARVFVYAPSPMKDDDTPFKRTNTIREEGPEADQPSVDVSQEKASLDASKEKPSADVPKKKPSVDPSEEAREFRYAIDMLMRQRTENLSVRFPLLGLAMDMNDLGIISGVALCVLLYIFSLTLTREEDNLKRALGRAEESRRKDNFELLLMAQVFSAPPKAKTGTGVWFYFVFFVPVALYLLVVSSDLFVPKSWEAGSLLLGHFWFWPQVLAEATFLIGVFSFSWRTKAQWKRNDDLLAEIESANKSCVERWRVAGDACV